MYPRLSKILVGFLTTGLVANSIPTPAAIAAVARPEMHGDSRAQAYFLTQTLQNRSLLPGALGATRVLHEVIAEIREAALRNHQPSSNIPLYAVPSSQSIQNTLTAAWLASHPAVLQLIQSILPALQDLEELTLTTLSNEALITQLIPALMKGSPTFAMAFNPGASMPFIRYKRVGPFVAQLNPLRGARPRPTTDRPRPPFSRSAQPLPGQATWAGQRENLVDSINKFALLANHVLSLGETLRPQFPTLRDIEAAFNAMEESAEGRRIASNSYGAGNTQTTKHDHDLRVAFPLEEGMMNIGLPVENYQNDTPDRTIAGVRIYPQKTDWPGTPLFLVSDDLERVSTVLAAFEDYYLSRAIPVNHEQLRRRSADGQHDEFVAILFTRTQNGDIPPLMNKGRFAIFEMGGMYFTTDPTAFEEFNEQTFAQSIRDMSATPDTIHRALDYIDQEFATEGYEAMRSRLMAAGDFFTAIYRYHDPAHYFGLWGEAVHDRIKQAALQDIHRIVAEHPELLDRLRGLRQEGSPITWHAPLSAAQLVHAGYPLGWISPEEHTPQGELSKLGQYGEALNRSLDEILERINPLSSGRSLPSLQLWVPLHEQDLEHVNCPICGQPGDRPVIYNVLNGIALPIVECPRDHMVYLSMRPNNEWYDRVYAAPEYMSNSLGRQFGYSHEHQYNAHPNARMKDAALNVDLVEKETGKRGGRWLDVGAAFGHTLREARARGWEVSAVEVNQRGVDELRRQNIPTVSGSWDNVQIQPNTEDVISFYDVFEHLSDPAQALRRVHQALREDGVVVIRLPDMGNLTDENAPTLLGIAREHLWYFSQETIRTLLEANGFEWISTTPSGIETIKGIPFQHVTVIARVKSQQTQRPALDSLSAHLDSYAQHPTRGGLTQLEQSAAAVVAATGGTWDSQTVQAKRDAKRRKAGGFDEGLIQRSNGFRYFSEEKHVRDLVPANDQAKLEAHRRDVGPVEGKIIYRVGSLQERHDMLGIKLQEEWAEVRREAEQQAMDPLLEEIGDLLDVAEAYLSVTIQLQSASVARVTIPRSEQRVELLPGLTVDQTDVESYVRDHPVRVKGRLPPPGWGDDFDMIDVWANTPRAENDEQTASALADVMARAGQEGLARFLRPLTRDALASYRANTFDRVVRVFLPFLAIGEEYRLVQDDLVFPYSWMDKLTREDFLFSLAHVDTRFKILFYDLYQVGVFDRYGPRARSEALRLCQMAEQLFATLLKTHDSTFTSHINNLLAVALEDRSIQILVGDEGYEYYREHKLAAQLESKDRAAMPFFKRADEMDFANSLVMALLAGVAFDESGSSFQATDRLSKVAEGGRIQPHMAINHIADLEADIQAAIIRKRLNPHAPTPRLEIMADDVIEIIGDLKSIQRALVQYPDLEIRLWVNNFAVENNIWVGELNRLLEDPLFATLRSLRDDRFQIYRKNSPLLTPDPRFLTKTEQRALETATAVLFRGTAPFETTQMVNANAYYGFTLWHQATAGPLGIPLAEGKGKAVFVHVPSGYTAFEYNRQTRTFTTTLQMLERTRRGILRSTVRLVKHVLIRLGYRTLRLWDGLSLDFLAPQGTASPAPAGYPVLLPRFA